MINKFLNFHELCFAFHNFHNNHSCILNKIIKLSVVRVTYRTRGKFYSYFPRENFEKLNCIYLLSKKAYIYYLKLSYLLSEKADI